MNYANIETLARLIEGLPPAVFDMRSVEDCGTPSCIAGWAAWLQLGRPSRLPEPSVDWATGCPVVSAALEFFGPATDHTSSYIKEHLFLGGFTLGDIEEMKITREQAAATLRHFALTGQVDWEAPITLP